MTISEITDQLGCRGWLFGPDPHGATAAGARRGRPQRRRCAYCPVAVTALLAAISVPASAQETERDQPRDTLTAIELDTVRVGGRIDDLIGVATTSAEGRVGAADLQMRPIGREGELLETVPGVIVTQHSGEGKANQYFVRGFNLDHGTDFQTRVEGMPVNMPSHGHGQGYTDLNFIIPELVDLLEYRLGVSHAELGDFGSAGGAEFHLARSLERPFVQATVGEHGLGRLVAAGSAPAAGGELLLGGEGRIYDGPWDFPQRLRKANGIARYSAGGGGNRLSVLALAYRNNWNASDQIPLRAVDSGLIGRFGQIDDTDGGDSQRYSLSVSWGRIGADTSREVQFFGIYSDLNLFSNFTYFLENPQAGDQFKQKDRRIVLGGNAKQVWQLDGAHALTIGAQNRTDVIRDVGLFATSETIRVSTVRSDEVLQSGTGLFSEAASRWRPWLQTLLGLRADVYTFDVESDRAANSGSERAAILSPKAAIAFTPISELELYLSGGYGFHSNDARGTTISVDPISGLPAERVDPLVRSHGAELGLRATPLPGLRSTLTGWGLQLESELLFVGDAGATEPSGASTRTGITWANFYRPVEGFTLDLDLSLARARLDEEAEGENRIPGAIERVIAGGFGWMPEDGAFGSIRVRHLGEYPLVEDNSFRADAATLLNAEAGYRFRGGLRIEVAALNLLDSDASDIQYLYASRLPGEPPQGVEDVHFHPVEPRQLRFTLHWEL